ncbi:MAG: bifunctional glutamate N-acetyltransferase/amino-acid acetyltransferase ArgJ [Dehalococcoidia bacterium]|nr:bifunctional glutamate N-acetyltransferase/amino-acid acetyltransferase ArgJ [Dehalococcoidia bacterium]
MSAQIIKAKLATIAKGSVTSPQGFMAGATYAGIKQPGKGVLDLGILASEAQCQAAGLFTTNKVQSAPVKISKKHLKSHQAGAIIVNSGCANACTGKKGLADTEEVIAMVAEGLSLSPENILAASTGIIGTYLPVNKISENLDKIVFSAEGGHDFARAMMTTDTFPKQKAVKVTVGETEFVIGGVAKGAGMIHPDLATMLCFITTDAAVEPGFLQRALKKAVEASLNMISIDGDTSPNDTVIILANGMAGNEEIKGSSLMAVPFQQALQEVCISLARDIARDGEGATKIIEVRVQGAKNLGDARRAARYVVSSPLVKAAIHGNDPNWGRIMVAMGMSGAEIRESRVELFINGHLLFKKGEPQSYSDPEVSSSLNQSEVVILVDLHLGRARATAWGCDLSEEYVTANSDYST